MDDSLDFNNTSSHGNAGNGTHTTWDYYGTLQTSLYGIWLVLIIVFSVVGNILVMIVICMVRNMRSVDKGLHLFLFSLAMTDMMTGIFVVPVSLNTLIHEEWLFGHFLCSLNMFLDCTLLLTSTHILMFISIHKYVTVKRLSQCNTRPVSKCACFVMIGASWLWGVCFAVLATVGLSKAEYKIKTTQCGPKYPDFTTISVALHAINILLNIVIPFCIMLAMYVKIYYAMKETGVFRRQSARIEPEMKSSSGEKAAINTLVIVITCFIVCWLPYVCYTNYVFFTSDRHAIPADFNPLAYYFGFTNSACNPIIYAFRFKDFRNGYKQIFKVITFRKQRDNALTKDDAIAGINLVKQSDAVRHKNGRFPN